MVPIPTWAAVLEPDLVVLDFAPLARITLWMRHLRDVVRAARIQRVCGYLVSRFDRRERPWCRMEFIPPSEFAAVIVHVGALGGVIDPTLKLAKAAVTGRRLPAEIQL